MIGELAIGIAIEEVIEIVAKWLKHTNINKDSILKIFIFGSLVNDDKPFRASSDIDVGIVSEEGLWDALPRYGIIGRALNHKVEVTPFCPESLKGAEFFGSMVDITKKVMELIR